MTRPVHLIGLRTLAPAPNDPVCEDLRGPWSESGILPVPLFLWYPAANIPRQSLGCRPYPDRRVCPLA